MATEDHLTTGEAAAVLGVVPETLRRYAAEKKIRHIRMPSGQLRFRREDLLPWLEIVETEEAAAS